jgi:hypothetical protein
LTKSPRADAGHVEIWLFLQRDRAKTLISIDENRGHRILFSRVAPGPRPIMAGHHSKQMERNQWQLIME